MNSLVGRRSPFAARSPAQIRATRIRTPTTVVSRSSRFQVSDKQWTSPVGFKIRAELAKREIARLTWLEQVGSGWKGEPS